MRSNQEIIESELEAFEDAWEEYRSASSARMESVIALERLLNHMPKKWLESKADTRIQKIEGTASHLENAFDLFEELEDACEAASLGWLEGLLPKENTKH